MYNGIFSETDEEYQCSGLSRYSLNSQTERRGYPAFTHRNAHVVKIFSAAE
jgi:hypothetical protein